MGKRKTAPAAESGGASAFDIDGLLAINQPAIDAMARLNTRIYENMMRLHAEFLDFTSRRLNADIEVAQTLTGGGKLDGAVEAVYGFQRQMISDYADEASGLVKMCTSMAEDFIQEVEDDVNEGAGEIEDYLKDDADEAAGAVAAEGAPPEPQAAETGEEVAAKGPVTTLKVPPKKTGEPDLQEVVLDVLTGSDEAISLAEIARKIGKEHYASLIGPMRSLRKMGRVVKEEKVYRLAGGASPR